MRKYTLADYVFQFVTVMGGVLIALLIDGLVDWNNNRELVNEARATIAREIADNKKDLESTLSGFAADQEALDNAIRFANDILSSGKTAITQLQLHFNMADLVSSAWRTAERTGAVSHMEYPEVQRYSKLYDFQDFFVTQQQQIVSQLTAASALLQGDFDPDKPHLKDLEVFRERVMQLQGAMRVQEDFAKRLQEYYTELLAR